MEEEVSELVNLTTARPATPLDVDRARRMWTSRWPRWIRRLWLWAHGWKLQHPIILRADASRAVDSLNRVITQLDAAECQRCAEIRTADPKDLVFFWDFSKYTHEQHQDGTVDRELAEAGERVRAMALAMHAENGHPGSDR
jgi:hypothetical protein